MRATSIVYGDVEVEDADASGFVVRIGNTRTFRHEQWQTGVQVREGHRNDEEGR